MAKEDCPLREDREETLYSSNRLWSVLSQHPYDRFESALRTARYLFSNLTRGLGKRRSEVSVPTDFKLFEEGKSITVKKSEFKQEMTSRLDTKHCQPTSLSNELSCLQDRGLAESVGTATSGTDAPLFRKAAKLVVYVGDVYTKTEA